MRITRLESRWQHWLPWARRHLLQTQSGSLEDFRALHRQRVERALASRVAWPSIVRYDLDDPRAEEIKFSTMLEWAVGMKPAHQRVKWTDRQRRVSA